MLFKPQLSRGISDGTIVPMDSRKRKIRWIGNSWSAVGLIALIGIVLAVLVHPLFYGIFLVYPFTPFLFVLGNSPFLMSMGVMAIAYLAIGEGLRKGEAWSRFAAIGLAMAMIIYFTALLIGLWTQLVKLHDLRFIWLIPFAGLWLIAAISAVVFLLKPEVGKVFVKTPGLVLPPKGEEATELGSSGE